MNEILQQIANLGIVPVVKIDNAKDAVPLAQALKDGGLPLAEITFRTAAAEESIRQICAACPDMLVGAGTVLTTDQAERAIKAGARFIVTPGFSPAVVKYCHERQIPITPGVATPTEIQMALEHGLDVVKFFPADAFGGIKTLKAMSAPFGAVQFIPTGGISAANLAEYILFPKVLACGGSWMVKDELIKAGKFDEITRLTQEAINVMLGFDLGHIGVNTADADASLGLTRQLSSMFNLALKEGNSSNFAGKVLEINKSQGLGAHGHIAIATNSIARAIAWLTRKGVAVDMNSAKKDAGGSIVAVYLKDEFGGFAVHLLQKK
ncbi:MAG: bifunctional 4-hydroxy-2-oxoglutarate aldolase/2-dehydro-3-deoxy-phosphogluconate aldolase [Verrucomicrobia bacterium]|nr:bifunctional 4-hydroxy-2-oxoglutarate aldolase/2-dehydro-3-deoxy-phosphogluconate aldolase [Verrucomicrobiota bacterium]MCG2679224.1 bifunctional 4-hydroxy-2-oxoglutarate aldolase/2-dehydro-3-deoxy-phosphogluconate aldolase [Kiritimatiellia bacterium]MBU4248618.1 bifunctional 4-hydroxy-2-oxoglutarate aldolase/2-dehydro-3-deoxy-phosphogluconate aldolase [Verrucomicrobiota bacterium]MBU4290079.1 bifunctional 4-hydroxy-2-oxoglutarate aldolase/2-dehydro-3-deoxy-phosphogluconate aldolase [Verrucom